MRSIFPKRLTGRPHITYTRRMGSLLLRIISGFQNEAHLALGTLMIMQGDVCITIEGSGCKVKRTPPVHCSGNVPRYVRLYSSQRPGLGRKTHLSGSSCCFCCCCRRGMMTTHPESDGLQRVQPFGYTRVPGQHIYIIPCIQSSGGPDTWRIGRTLMIYRGEIYMQAKKTAPQALCMHPKT